MKQTFLFIFICFSIIVQGQNLVPNPSFEEYYTCPPSAGGLGVNGGDPWIMDWYSMQWTPDYMHYCAGEGASNYPTDNAWGYQEPFDGEGYVSIATKAHFSTEREYIAVELYNPLTIGEIYEVSFYISDADGGELEYIDCVSNNIGLRFLTNPSYYWLNESDNFPLLPINYAEVNYSEIMSDSLGWTEVSGVFTANESYTHIAIGNHFDDENTIIIESGVEDGCAALYYIDMVCVVKSEDNCDISSSIIEYEFRDISFQNIVTDILDLSGTEQFTIDEIQIFDVSGKLIKSNDFGDRIINVSRMNFGMYILQVKFKDGLINNYKFIKQ